MNHNPSPNLSQIAPIPKSGASPWVSGIRNHPHIDSSQAAQAAPDRDTATAQAGPANTGNLMTGMT